MSLPFVKCGCLVNVVGQAAQQNNNIHTQRHMVYCANACNILWGLLLNAKSVQPPSDFDRIVNATLTCICCTS